MFLFLFRSFLYFIFSFIQWQTLTLGLLYANLSILPFAFWEASTFWGAYIEEKHHKQQKMTTTNRSRKQQQRTNTKKKRERENRIGALGGSINNRRKKVLCADNANDGMHWQEIMREVKALKHFRFHTLTHNSHCSIDPLIFLFRLYGSECEYI